MRHAAPEMVTRVQLRHLGMHRIAIGGRTEGTAQRSMRRGWQNQIGSMCNSARSPDMEPTRELPYGPRGSYGRIRGRTDVSTQTLHQTSRFLLHQQGRPQMTLVPATAPRAAAGAAGCGRPVTRPALDGVGKGGTSAVGHLVHDSENVRPAACS